jgi:hypothetical protein
VWLAHPSDEAITPWDEAVEWTSAGPSRPQNEIVNGTLGVMPPVTPPIGDVGSPVNEVLLEFAKGILAYLSIKANEETGGDKSLGSVDSRLCK